MKKILVVLLILAISAGAVFAQISGDPALKITGEVVTGLTFHKSEGTDDPTLGFYNDDAGPIRAKLAATYTQENHGAEIVLLFKPGMGLTNKDDATGTPGTFEFDFGNVALDTAKVWGEVLNDMVRFTVGTTGSAWGSGGRLDTSSGDSNLLVEIKPITPLNFGFTLGDRGNSWLKDPKTTYFTSITNNIYSAEDMFRTFGGGVKYTAEDGFITVAAGARITPLNDDGNKAYLDAIIKPIGDPLEIEVGAAAFGLGDFDDESAIAKIKGALSGQYKTDGDNAGSLTVYGGGNIMYFLQKDSALGWWAGLNLFYQVSDPVKVGIESGFQSSVKDTDSVWDTRADKDDDAAVRVEVTPQVIYKFASNAEIKFFYRLKVHTLPKDNLEHQVQVNFGWSF